jgi:4-hydroxymandelate oxidase
VTPDTAELERRARELLPLPVYEFFACGSGSERTLRANQDAWHEVWLAPRVFRDVSAVDTSISLLGAEMATPLCVAPTAFHRLAHPEGELATATGAARSGALFVLSTRSTQRIEDVARVIEQRGGTWWFQVYVLRDRQLTAALVRRAAAAGASALVLTGDTPVVGRKRRNVDDVATEEDLLVNLGQVADLQDLGQGADVTFADIGWLAEISSLPVVAKGVLRADDALACAAAGAAAVIVSNHGGRQLDGAQPTARALPEVAGALADRIPVYADGGIRTGDDALAALALGAQAVFIGRPVLWALACGGADAVADLLIGLTSDLAYSMALAGASRVSELGGIALPAGTRHDHAGVSVAQPERTA